MARAKTSEQSRSRSKAATIEELTRGVGKLQEFLAQVEDLGREGFPYLDAARARTELQFRECIRRTFGEKSPEFQEHRHHKLLMGSPEDTQQSIALIKTLIVTLEQKKLELRGGPPPVQIPPTPAVVPPTPTRPQMTLVPASIPTVRMTMTQPAPVTPPPMIMSVAMTTNLDMSSATTAPSHAPLSPAPSTPSRESQPLIPSTPPPEPSATSPISTTMSSTLPQPAAQSVPVSTPPPPQTPQTTSAAPSHVGTPPQPAQREPAPIMHSTPPARPQHRRQDPHPIPSNLEPRPSAPVDPSSHQESTAPSPQAGSDPFELVKTLCGRFHSVARQLRLRGEYRATLSVEDEFDTQDLLHALLRIQFDDIGTDEWVPNYSDGATRTTFLLNDSRLAVVVKKTRPGLNAKDLTDQLRIDAERYRSRDRCTMLFCFIYDPEGRIGNPRGLETNLTSVSDSFVVEVLVAPK